MIRPVKPRMNPCLATQAVEVRPLLVPFALHKVEQQIQRGQFDLFGPPGSEWLIGLGFVHGGSVVAKSANRRKGGRELYTPKRAPPASAKKSGRRPS